MTTSTVAPEIARFAAAVREALADLPEDERDDLTDGLEADLSESLAEDLRRTLPDPVAYAAELRAAAGLPARARKRGAFAGLVQGWRDTMTDVGIAIRRNPTLAGIADFAISLRPAWWVLRAWVAYYALASVGSLDTHDVLPGAPLAFLVFAALLIVSVLWGRGRLHLPRGMTAILAVGNVAALLLVVPLVSHAYSLVERPIYEASSETQDQTDMTGVYLNGTAVTNIFGYDAEGKPLSGVQLFDQDGNPLATAVAGGNGCFNPTCSKDGLWVPSTLRNGVVAWNVFPMQMIRADYGSDGQVLKPAKGASPTDRVAPFNRVPALVSAEKVAKSNQ